MTLHTLVLMSLVGGIVLFVFALGLTATWSEATFLFRRPGLLARSMLAMNVLTPIAAAALALAFHLPPAVKIALVALAVSPVPPFLPKKEIKAGGEASNVIGLLVASGLLAIAVVPLSLAILERVFNVPLNVSAAKIARTVGMSVVGPLVLGLAGRALAPAAAARLARPIGLLAAAFLVAGGVAILVKLSSGMWTLIGNGTLVAMVGLCAAGLLAGHLCGGSRPGDRAALALASASRHPGVAMAIATASFPDETLVRPAILLSVIVSMVVTVPYVQWMRRRLVA
jgi:bile acid:Na+ symporter, BASS family